MNNKILKKIQKIFCIFFVGIFCFSAFGSNVHSAESKAPPEKIDKNDGGNWITATDGNNVTHTAFVQFYYQYRRTGYDKKEGRAYYKVGEYFNISHDMTYIYSDKLYVNNAYYGKETYIDTWSKNNGWKSIGTHKREDWFNIVLSEGDNYLVTKGEKGTGGNSEHYIYLEPFREYTVTFQDWDGTKIKEEVVESGSCPTYPSDPTRHGYTFSSWDKSCGTSGITENTTITAQYNINKYNVNYYGNGATSGSTVNQTADYNQWFNLSNNGFVRQYSVAYNGNGGTPSKSSDVAKATFKGWLDDNSFDGYQSYTFNAPYYAHKNPDVLNVFGFNKEALFNHWFTATVNGNETRTSSPYFNVGDYMRIGGGDLNNALGNNKLAFTNHWNLTGYSEHRNGISTVDTTTSKTYPNQAYVKNFSYANGTNVNLKADWKLNSVTLPSGSRPGYKLIYWKNSSGQKVGEPGKTYTPKKNETLIAVWDKAPTITATNKTFYEGQYADSYWKNTLRWQGIKASDPEDGDLTSKIKIVSDNVNVNKKGTYKVVYSVTDKVGQTSTATSTVTVKYNNPPVITAKDQAFYEGQYTDSYWKNTLRWKDVSASDVEDGNITSKIQITSDNVNVNKPGVYNVTYKVTDRFGKSSTKTIKVTVKFNNPPVITAKDQTFYEGQYTDSYWKNTLRWKDVSASDVEDGNITSKIQITSDNVNVNKPGVYSVTYKVTDRFGKSATKTIRVTVKYNNPPTIKGEDRWFYESEQVTTERLMERVKANDIEDGNITKKAKIKSSNVQSGVVGTYQVTYMVTDAFGKSATTTNIVNIIPDTPLGADRNRYIRFIDAQNHNTLKSNSIWRSDYAGLLQQTLQSPSVKETWVLSEEDIAKIKEFNATHDFSKESNEAFYAQFSHLRK